MTTTNQPAGTALLDAVAPAFGEKQFSFVCGAAGTGKTFLMKDLAAKRPGHVLCATTGIAAVNLGEGTTINSLLKYFDTRSLQEAYTAGFLNATLRRLWSAGLRRFILDEVSMLDGDQLTMLVRAIEEVGGQGYDVSDNSDPDDEKPHIGLTLVGDFAQLAPVKAPFAFESAVWETHFQDNTLALTEIRRQADKDFIEAIQAVRNGRPARALEFFRTRFETYGDNSFDGVTIFAKNDAVARYNQLKLDKLATPIVKFKSERWGKQRSEWGNPDKHPSTWGIPQELILKEKALVMVLANQRERTPTDADPNPPFTYVNGDLGVLESADGMQANVTLQRTGRTVQVEMVTRQVTIPMEPGRRKELHLQGLDDRIAESGKYEIIGEITYMPLRLAWASTVHKTQGLSLDSVQINIGDHFFTSPGMLYVALSRARTPEGLRLVGSERLFAERCAVHPKVQRWL